jgi:penicillin-binding protein 2
MRVALLKDPEIRAMIEKPLPMPEAPPTEDGGVPEPPIIAPPPQVQPT